MPYKQNKWLWLLEDDLDVLHVVNIYALQAGFRVTSMISIQDAWAQLNRALANGQNPTHVISDFHLPDGTSMEWLLRTRQLWTAVPMLCFSGDLPLEQKTILKSQRIDSCPKTTNLAQLLQAWGR